MWICPKCATHFERGPSSCPKCGPDGPEPAELGDKDEPSSPRSILSSTHRLLDGRINRQLSISCGCVILSRLFTFLCMLITSLLFGCLLSNCPFQTTSHLSLIEYVAWFAGLAFTCLLGCVGLRRLATKVAN